MNCRLCNYTELKQLIGLDKLEYHQCENCKIIIADPKDKINYDKEKERYLTHNNGIEFEGYRNFLYRAINPALKFINKNMIGLDYGCGYAPTLSKLLKLEGIECDDYDPFFFRNKLKEKYDFIFSTEVFEHFFNPKKEIEKLTELLNINGYLIIMTERWKSETHFSDWYYTKDPTHIAFYHNDTFDYICQYYGYDKVFDDGKRVIILRKLILNIKMNWILKTNSNIIKKD